MKKVILVVLLCATYSVGFAQQFSAGLRGAFNSTWLFNKMDSDAGDELDYASTFGGDFGVGAEIIFNDKIGVALDVVMSSNNQKYDLQDPAGNASEATQKISTIDIPIMFKVMSPGGAFFEVGPNIGLVSTSEFEGMGVTVDTKSTTASTNFEAMIGFGVDLEISEVLSLTTGLRFGWGLTDITDDNRMDPTNTAAGGLRLGLNYIISNN